MMMWPWPGEEPRNNPRPASTPPADPTTELYGRVRRRLDELPEIGRRAVTVEVQHGVVLLSGTVESPAARAATSRAVREVDGVRDVCNMTTVSTTRRQAADSGQQDRTFEAITESLIEDDPSLARNRIRLPRSPVAQAVLAVLAVGIWGGWSILLVVVGWPLVLITCVVVAVAANIVHGRRQSTRPDVGRTRRRDRDPGQPRDR